MLFERIHWNRLSRNRKTKFQSGNIISNYTQPTSFYRSNQLLTKWICQIAAPFQKISLNSPNFMISNCSRTTMLLVNNLAIKARISKCYNIKNFNGSSTAWKYFPYELKIMSCNFRRKMKYVIFISSKFTEFGKYLLLWIWYRNVCMHEAKKWNVIDDIIRNTFIDEYRVL